MVDFAPGMRTIIRDEEWMIKKIETMASGDSITSCKHEASTSCRQKTEIYKYHNR